MPTSGSRPGLALFDLLDLKSVRQTLRDAAMTAKHASIATQNRNQGRLPFETLIIMMFMIIVKTLKLNSDPIASFWPSDI